MRYRYALASVIVTVCGLLGASAQAAPTARSVQPVPVIAASEWPGVEGNQFTGPISGFRLSWDPERWSVAGSGSNTTSGQDSLQLFLEPNKIGMLGLYITSEGAGEPAACVDDWLAMVRPMAEKNGRVEAFTGRELWPSDGAEERGIRIVPSAEDSAAGVPTLVLQSACVARGTGDETLRATINVRDTRYPEMIEAVHELLAGELTANAVEAPSETPAASPVPAT